MEKLLKRLREMAVKAPKTGRECLAVSESKGLYTVLVLYA